jgi:hypothetical protein
MTPKVSAAMMAVAELGIAVGAAPLNARPGCWEHQVDDRWWIACNPHPELTKCSRGVNVAPFRVYIEFNGWPAGIVGPDDGWIAAGTAANEDALLGAIRAAIAGVSS